MPRRVLGWSCVLVLAAAGCEEQIGPPPVTLRDQAGRSQSPRNSYPRFTVVQHNLQRALDNSLPEAQRTESLKLADTLGGGEPGVRESIGELLGDPDAPDALREAALAFLLRRDAPGLGETLMKHWATLAKNERLRAAAVGYLERHPNSQVFSGIVQFWAEAPRAVGPDERRYRRVVERTAKKPWADALLEGINTPGFRAKGSAVKILSRRLTSYELKDRISRIQPRDPAMVALQISVDRLDYIPASGTEFISTVVLVRRYRDTLPDVEKLRDAWTRADSYRFNIRDFHLLRGLARDPLRVKPDRLQLVADLGRRLMLRHHARDGRMTRTSGFGYVSEKLTLADLWNVFLLDEMLSRPGMQRALLAVSAGDRNDRRSQWGGLVFYESGGARARLYKTDPAGGENDLVYVPSERFRSDSRDSLCRFVGHFDKVSNVGRAWPTKDELLAAQRGNYYGLVLTNIDDRTVAAHYHNPRRVVVSLGTYPLRP